MSKLCFITNLIRFMMKEADKRTKWSIHKDYFFFVHDALVLMTAKETIKWTKEKNYFHHWLLPKNGSQDRTPYSGRPVGNSLEFMPLDNILNRDILHILRFNSILSRFLLDGEGTDKEERNTPFSLSTPKEIYRELKRIWELKMGTPSLAMIIQDVDLALKALEIVYRAN